MTSLLLLLAAAASAAVSGIDVLAEGSVTHLIEGRSGGEVSLWHLSVGADGKGSAPARVDKGLPAPYRAHAGDMRLAADGKTLFVIYSASGTGPAKSGPLAAALSQDGGKSWKRAGAPGSDGAHGRRFPAVVFGGGALHAVWIDRGGGSRLLYARSSDLGRSWSKPVNLDDGICECCWNALAFEDGKLCALYRDRDPRDMNAVCSADGGVSWAAPTRIGGFRWRFNACPHVGGALASNGGFEALVWDGSEKKRGLYFARSEGGKSWSQPALVSADGKHGDLASDGKRLAAVWSDGAGALSAALSEDGGKSWKTRALVPENAMHPRVIGSGGKFRVFWLEHGAGWSSREL